MDSNVICRISSESVPVVLHCTVPVPPHAFNICTHVVMGSARSEGGEAKLSLPVPLAVAG